MGKIFKILLIILLIIVAALAVFFWKFEQAIKTPLTKENPTVKIIEISEGETKIGLAADLGKKGLIKSALVFSIYSRFQPGVVKPGYYEISSSQSTKEIYEVIISQTVEMKKLTIPEGYRLEQIGQKLDGGGVTGYSEFIEVAVTLEGRLFPDTYFFHKNIKAALVVDEMVKNFDQKTAGLKHTKEDIVIASIVERETAKDTDRPLIAGVYKNRQKIGMKLEADPTVQYGKDDNSIANLSVEEILNFKFWPKITSADYRSVISNYNTYLNEGLPPRPICNPGLKSLEATVNYTKNNYLFFFHDGDGEIHLSKTVAEHDANKKKYLY